MVQMFVVYLTYRNKNAKNLKTEIMYTFKNALQNCNKNQKIIYGTRTEMFHIIESNDRDFNTNYASPKDVADKLGEVKTVLKSIGRL